MYTFSMSTFKLQFGQMLHLYVDNNCFMLKIYSLLGHLVFHVETLIFFVYKFECLCVPIISSLLIIFPAVVLTIEWAPYVTQYFITGNNLN